MSETVSINRREPLSTASTWFTVTPDAVYCGNNTSDDPNHDTVLCRIDRENYDVDGLVLNCEEFKAKAGAKGSWPGRRPSTSFYRESGSPARSSRTRPA